MSEGVSGEHPRVGYVGMGQLGAAMAGRLLDVGVPVSVFDLDTAATAAMVKEGAEVAASGAELASTCDVVSVCVPDAGHVDLAIADLAHGTARRDRPLTVMLHSTVHPDTVMSARRALAGAGGRLHDVCVAGGATAAREGQLVLFVGGRGEMADEAAYLLDHYGNHVVAARPRGARPGHSGNHGGAAGPGGAGAAMKLAFNVQTYAQFAATATAFGMASSAAVDRDALAEAWRHVGQLGALTEQFLPILELGSGRLVGAARDRMQATVDIARKDLRLAAELCDDGVLEGLLEALGSAMPEVFGVGDGATDDGRGR